MRAIILLLALSVPFVGQTTCSSANFEPGPMSESSLTSEFKGAILRLQVPGSPDSGTGYLIDSVNGYVITAFHVIESARPGTSIDVTSPGLAGTKLRAKLVKSLATVRPDGTVNGTDLAILKLDTPSLVKDIRPVDVSLRFPAVDQILYAMGYPQLGAEPNVTFSEQPVKFMAAPPDGSIQVTQATFGGNSGGPLMDPSGSVVGTCRETVGIGAAVARYIPMSDGETLLDLIPLSDRMRRLDQQVKAGSVSESDLKDILVKNSKNPTNVELYTWARQIVKNRDQYSAVITRNLLQCPMRALMQRGMDDLVIELSAFSDPKTVGDANATVAAREIAQGRPLSAESHVQAAAAAYTIVNDTQGTYRAAMLSTRIQLAVGSIDAAAAQSSKVLANINILAPKDRATALATAADIDLAKGNGAAAIPKLNRASQYSIEAGQFTTAANLLASSAEVSLKMSKLQDAKDSLTKAINLYHGARNSSGEAESVYKRVGVETVLGDNAASKLDLQHYLDIEPQGFHSAEVKELLAIPTMRPKSVVQ